MVNCLHGTQEYTRLSIKGDNANIWTSDPFTAALLANWATQYPEDVRVRQIHQRVAGAGAGKTDWVEYDVPATWIRFDAEESA